MGRYQTGDVICLNWPCGMEAAYVKGHIPPEEAIKAIKNYYGEEYEFEEPFPTYGRYVPSEYSEEPGEKVFVTGYKKGRGAMPVMEAQVIHSKE